MISGRRKQVQMVCRYKMVGLYAAKNRRIFDYEHYVYVGYSDNMLLMVRSTLSDLDVTVSPATTYNTKRYFV